MKLKPCPFCGEIPVIKKSFGESKLYVECENPSCNVLVQSDNCLIKDEAINIWNTRAYENEIYTLENRLKYLLQSEVVRMYDEVDPEKPDKHIRDITELDRLVFDSKHEDKTAHWDINCDGYYPYCSNCKEEPQGGKLSPYCPNCGAKMITRED